MSPSDLNIKTELFFSIVTAFIETKNLQKNERKKSYLDLYLQQQQKQTNKLTKTKFNRIMFKKWFLCFLMCLFLHIQEICLGTISSEYKGSTLYKVHYFWGISQFPKGIWCKAGTLRILAPSASSRQLKIIQTLKDSMYTQWSLLWKYEPLRNIEIHEEYLVREKQSW